MAWIESHQEIGRHPKTKKFARRLGVSIPTAVGHLHLLWHWAMDFAEDGALDDFESWELADAAMWEGDPDEFVDALIAVEYIDRTDSGSELHDWHGGHPSRKRRSGLRREWEAMRRRVAILVFERDDWRCVDCGATHTESNPLEVDHIAPLSREGTNDFDNLQTLCRSCNRRKGAR